MLREPRFCVNFRKGEIREAAGVGKLQGEVTNACLPSPSRWGDSSDTGLGRELTIGLILYFQLSHPGNLRPEASGYPNES